MKHLLNPQNSSKESSNKILARASRLLNFSFHWNELCEETGTIESQIEKNDILDFDGFKKIPLIIGTQNIPKFGKLQDTTAVKIRLLCLRIPSITSDILISLSSPITDFEVFSDDFFIEICKSFVVLKWDLFK